MTHVNDDLIEVKERSINTNATVPNVHNRETQCKHHTLRTAMKHLGFITASLDGTIFIWRRSNNYLKPNILA